MPPAAMPGFARQITAAPHRTLFLPGAVQAVATMSWWLLELWPRLGGPPLLPAPDLAPGLAHAWLMLYGLLPFFVFGFLFTALPNWQEAGPIARRDYLATGGLMAAGALLFYPGLYLPGLAIAAVLVHLAGWAVALNALYGTLRASRLADRQHAYAVVTALVLGWLGELAYAAWLAGGDPVLADLAVQLGLWGCLTPLFLAVCHRMIPWFSSRVLANYVIIRPYGALWLMLAASLGHGLLTAAGRPDWTWPADLVLAALALWFTSRWGIARTFGVRLLAMLHIGFLWATLAFLLAALSGLAALIGLGGFALAPLHALAVGFFGSMLIGMASRVSLGHSGRKLEADGYTWTLFWIVQAAALARMLPDLMAAPYALVVMSALLWLGAFLPWSARYAPYYWRPRVDGKPG